MADTFPYGYKGAMRTIAQLETYQTVYKLNPEFWRRYKALMIFARSQGVKLGVGTGWRIQPNPPPPGFAPPGNSNHEGFPADGKTGGAVAIDTVVSGSWPWMERNLRAYGLRSFHQPSTNGYTGSREDWHIQPYEIPAGRENRSTPWKLNTFPLPTSAGPPPPKPPTPTPTWAQDLMKKLPVLTPGGLGLPVKRMQHFLALAGEMSATNMANFDGKFGSGTQAALNRFKASHKLPQDSRCDSTVWSYFCAAGDGLPTLKRGATGTDVQRMQRMLSANGFMEPSNQANFDGQFGSGTESALRNLQTKRQLVVDGVCAQQSWTSLLNG